MKCRLPAPALLLVALVINGCAKNEPRDAPNRDCPPSERVVDPALLAFLSQARSAHHVADQQEAAGNTTAALAALQSLTRGTRPAPAPEIDEVLADTQARIADLLSRAGQFDQADAAIHSGLESATSPTYFRGHLLEVRGLVEERRAQAFRSAGRGQEADQARERSLSAYEEAMKIQAAVIQQGAAPPAAPK